MKKRAIDLGRGIRELLNDPAGTGLTKQVYNHALIDGLFRGKFDEQKGAWPWTNLPSYIPVQAFTLALMSVVSKNPPGGNQPASPLDQLREGINQLENAQVKQALLSLVGAAQNDLVRARANIEAWFNSAMDRVAGWYKRWTQAVIFVLGLLLVAVLNVDTVAIGDSLVRDASLRQALVGAVKEEAKRGPRNPGGSPEQQLGNYVGELQKLGMPIGWDPNNPRTWPDGGWGWFFKVIGLLLTALAISLGAPGSWRLMATN
jgi:hypothetical protein